jgi:hypothetical protein
VAVLVLAVAALILTVALRSGDRHAPAPPPPSPVEPADPGETARTEGAAPADRPARPSCWRLAIEVLDTAGRPVAGARVRFIGPAHYTESEADAWEVHAEAETGADGLVSLDAIGSGLLDVRPAGGSLAPALVTGLSPPPGGGQRLTVRLEHGLSIAGTVFAPDGRTPARARVRAVAMHGPVSLDEPVEAETEAGGDGRFLLSGLPRGRFALDAWPVENPDLRESGPPVVAEAGTDGVELRLRPFALLEVVLHVGGDGPPELDAADFRVEDPAGHLVASVEDLDAHETPRFRLPPGETYHVTGFSPGWTQAGDGTVEIGPEESRRTIVLPLRWTGGSTARLRLFLRDEGGAPVERVGFGFRREGAVRGVRARHCPEGVLDVALPPGKWSLRVERPAGDPAPLAPYLPEEFELSLAPGEGVEREVFLRTGGFLRVLRPHGAVVSIHPDPWEALWQVRRLDSDRPEILPPGTWTLDLHMGLEEAVSRKVEVRPGEITEVDFR